MTEMIARCGFRCDLCPAFRENQEEGADPRATAENWSAFFGVDMPPEQIKCNGCLAVDDPALALPDKGCQIRPCVIERGLDNCASCPDYMCDKLRTRTVSYEKVASMFRGMLSQEKYDKFFAPYDVRKTLNEIRLKRGFETSRKQHWEQVYGTKSPLDVSWHQDEPRLSWQLIQHTGVGKGAAVIDVGGGASVLVDRLVAAGYRQVTVLDISGKALAWARERLGGKASQVTWLETDVTSFEPSSQFDLWHDRAVFHFLTDAGDRRRYVATLKRALKPGGHLIVAAFAIGGPLQCSNLDIVQYDAQKLSAELGQEFRLVEEAGEVHITPAKKEQEFAYFRFVRKEG